ncbi:MAG TPA: hypothetical protein VK856_02595 [Anaerolineaceae bacterium]|nr:hypothetical protein [Anaerolineaceae bacterium]
MENEEPTKKYDENNEEEQNQELENTIEAVDEFQKIETTEEPFEQQKEEFEPVSSEQSDVEIVDEQSTIDQPDDSEKEFEDLESTTQEEPTAKDMPKWLKSGLIYFAIAALLLLAGYLIAFYTTTTPAQRAYQTAVSELQNTENTLDTLQNQFNQLDVDLENTKNDLSDLESSYQALNQDFDALVISSEFDENLASLKYEIANARYYMLNEDKISSRQVVILAKGYFESIKGELDSEIASGIEDRLSNIQKAINTKPDEALDELRTLMENLERISLK